MILLARVLLPLLVFCTCVAGSLLDDIVDALRGAVNCAGCHTLLVPLKGLALLGDAAFTNTFVAVCKALKVEDDDVCEGAVGQQAPILAHDLRSISPIGQTSTKFCDAVFGLCQPPAVNAYSVPFPKPTPTSPRNFTSTGKAPFEVVHFSDVHVDRQYTPGSEANCTKPICCRRYPDNNGTPTVPAGRFGDRHCDTSTGLIRAMLRSIATNNKFSIFTGDVVDGALWLLNQEVVTSDLQTLNSEMATFLSAPVYPAMGNHEAAPVNAFPRNTTSGASAQWIFDTQSTGWASWIQSAGADQVKHFSGSYSIVVPGTNLRIISINDIYWYKMNFWLYDSDNPQPDPNGMLAFLVQQLQTAEDAGQRAWIIAHMPPGRHDALNDQSNYFNQVVQRYRNTIAGQFYGHSHQDEFALAYSDYSKQTAENAVSVGWIAPAVTPRGGNPEFRVYDVDPDTYEIMDSRVFISDLSDPTFQTNPTWKLHYSARQTYGPLVGLQPTQSLSPAFWHRVTEAFVTNDAAFQQFVKFQARGVSPPACTGDCKTKTICELRALRAENNCDDSEPGLNFRSMASGKHRIRRQCNPTGLGHILTQIPAIISTVDRAALIARIEEAIVNT